MWKTLTVFVLALSLPVPAATADEVKDCLQATFEVAKVAQDKNPNDDQVKALEDKMLAIEEMCDAKKFAEAEAARTELASMISNM